MKEGREKYEKKELTAAFDKTIHHFYVFGLFSLLVLTHATSILLNKGGTQLGYWKNAIHQFLCFILISGNFFLFLSTVLHLEMLLLFP